MFVYTISNFCSRYTDDLGSTWELGSGFATSFYLSGSLVKKSNFVKLLIFINCYINSENTCYTYIARGVYLYAPTND